MRYEEIDDPFERRMSWTVKGLIAALVVISGLAMWATWPEPMTEMECYESCPEGWFGVFDDNNVCQCGRRPRMRR